MLRLGGEIGVVDDPEQRAGNPGLGKGAQQEHRVAAPAAARIVGDIGKDERGHRLVAPRRKRLCDGIIERGELGVEPRAVVPAVVRDLAGEGLGGGLVAARGHDDAEAVLGCVGIGKAAHHRDVHDRRVQLFLAALAELDHLGVGTGGSQHGHARRHDRQAQPHPRGLRAGEQLRERRGRLGAALAHVEMRVGAVADKGVDPVDHAVGDVGVQVETGDDRHAGADDIADGLEKDAFGVVLLCRQRRAVCADIDTVERQGRLEPACDRVEQLGEKPMLDRPVGPAHRQRDADRVPRPGRVHCRDKAGRLRQHRRGGRARFPPGQARGVASRRREAPSARRGHRCPSRRRPPTTRRSGPPPARG